MTQKLQELSHIRFARCRVRLRALEGGPLPRQLGRVLRGAMGAALRAVSCPTPDKLCEMCLLAGGCAYLQVFETPRPASANRLRGVSSIPRPFVLRPWEAPDDQIEQGKILDFELVLVGEAMRALPHLAVALGLMAGRGLGGERVPFTLLGIDQVITNDDQSRALFEGYRLVELPLPDHLRQVDVQEAPGRLTLEFLSPVCIVSGGRTVENLALEHLVRALMRRLSSLSYFHCGHELDLDFAGLKELARDVTVVESSLRPVRLQRYSRRQDRHMQMQGVVGSVSFTGDRLEAFMPLIALGETLHVGKNAVMGMGRYRVQDGS